MRCAYLVKVLGIELYHVVNGFHDDVAIVQHHRLTVVKRLCWHTVILVEAVHKEHLVVSIEEDARNAVRCGHPDLVITVFNDGVYHVVKQAVTLCKYHRLLLGFLKQIEARHRANPHPSATVAILAVGTLTLKFCDVLRDVCHHVVIDQRLRVRPGITFEGRFRGTSIEHTSTLSTNPDAALLVEGNHVTVRLHFRAIGHCELFHPLQFLALDVVHPEAILRGHINLVLMESQVINMVCEL